MAEQRLLLAGSPAWGYVPSAGAVLRQLRQSEHGFADWTLMYRDNVGVEGCCGRWWRDYGGRTELFTDVETAAARADGCLAFIADRCPRACEVMFAAEDAGLGVILCQPSALSQYPYRPGSLHYRDAHPAQLNRAAKERDASERARKASVAAASAARRQAVADARRASESFRPAA